MKMMSKDDLAYVIQKLWAIRGSYFPYTERQAQQDAWEEILMLLETKKAETEKIL